MSINYRQTYRLTEQTIKSSIVYTDRNGVYYKTKNGKDKIIANTINQLNSICSGGLKVISNESEDPKEKILNADKNNGILIDPINYALSYEQGVNFIKNVLGFNKCFFVGNEIVAKEVEKMGMEIVNLSEVTNNVFIRPFINKINGLPILFARPVSAIQARCKTKQEIDNELDWDFALDAVKLILSNSDSKVVFCHTKPNCPKNDYIELNLGYYFDYLLNTFNLQVGKNIFNVGKGNYSKGEIFDTALNLSHKKYENVIGIGDMWTDIHYTLQNGGRGIFVLSGDEQIDDDLKKQMEIYSDNLIILDDISGLRFE